MLCVFDRVCSQGIGAFLGMLSDAVSVVRDSAAWVIGHMAELVPSVIDHTTLQELRAAVGPGRLPRLIGVFADETRARVARLTSTDDVSLIEEEAHGLKCAAGTFGAAALRSIAASLEEACVARDMVKIS